MLQSHIQRLNQTALVFYFFLVRLRILQPLHKFNVRFALDYVFQFVLFKELRKAFRNAIVFSQFHVHHFAAKALYLLRNIFPVLFKRVRQFFNFIRPRLVIVY